ncbi:MAG TPA: hypothetical protein VGR65_02090 [Casimicrobiaceae bacterium]|jgi:hypothetical protein|nr:hypothetical protein [Casimicrobiaceae bacterium]
MGNFESISRNGLTAGEVCLLDCINDAKDDLRELFQRWDNRLTFKGLSLVEKYCEGRLSMALKMRIAGGLHHYVQYAASTNSERAICESHIADRRIDVRKRHNGKGGYQEAMFIGNVETVKRPDGVIIPSFVWLYSVQNEGDDIDTGDLYFSPIKDTFQFLPRISDWEVRMTGRNAASHSDDFASQKIQSGSEVVNCIPDHQRDIFWHGLSLLELQYVSSNEICLDAETAKISVNECCNGRVEFLDVVIGPFNL